MADLNPIGSEKLSVDAKLKRILELTYFQKGNNTTTPIKKSEYLKESVNGGVYGIVKERNEYYVKQGLNENTLDYIGGMFMKNKNKFSSFGDALKRVEFLCGQEVIQEATKYVLKQPKPKTASAPVPQAEAPMPSAPMPETPAGGGGMGADMGADMGNSADMGSDMNMPPPPEDDGMGQDDGMGGGIDSDQGGDERLKLIQKLTGKLGQKLRGYKEKLDSDGIQYVLNSILSALDIEKLDDEAREDIISRFEEDENGDNGMGGNDMGGGEETPDKDMDETMDTLENMINTPFDADEDFSFDMIDRSFKDRDMGKHNSDNVVQGEDSIDSEVDEDTIVNDDDEDDFFNVERHKDNMGDDTHRHHNDENGDDTEYYPLKDEDLDYNYEDPDSTEADNSPIGSDYFDNWDQDDEDKSDDENYTKHRVKGNYGFSMNENDPQSSEMSLDEITNAINKNIKQTLSKYFK